LVVFATGSLIPWEAIEAVRRPGWVRIVILLINTAVVLYLLRIVARQRRPPPAGAAPES